MICWQEAKNLQMGSNHFLIHAGCLQSYVNEFDVIEVTVLDAWLLNNVRLALYTHIHTFINIHIYVIISIFRSLGREINMVQARLAAAVFIMFRNGRC